MILVTNNDIYYGNSENIPVKISGGEDTSPSFDISPELGNAFTMGAFDYLIVHVSDNSVVAALHYYRESSQFSSDESVSYGGSELEARCTDWYNSMIPESLKTKEPFIGTCFIPTLDEVNGDFQYYATRSNRIFYNSSNAAYAWWTSTSYNVYNVHAVDTNGNTDRYAALNPDESAGVRPHIYIYKSAFAA